MPRSLAIRFIKYFSIMKPTPIFDDEESVAPDDCNEDVRFDLVNVSDSESGAWRPKSRSKDSTPVTHLNSKIVKI